MKRLTVTTKIPDNDKIVLWRKHDYHSKKTTPEMLQDVHLFSFSKMTSRTRASGLVPFPGIFSFEMKLLLFFKNI